jgi:parallel beta-helix repeat protein
MKKRLVLAIVAGVMWISSSDVCAVNYYVDAAGGNDNNNGRSETTAWKTISKANSELRAGETVYLRGGSYKEKISPNRSGSFGNYITYENYNGETVILTGSLGADIANKSYIRIIGLRLTNTSNRWIRFDNVDRSIIQNCICNNSGAWSGIQLKNDSDYNQILDNFFTAGSNGPSDSVCVSGGCDYNLFQNNLFQYACHANMMILSSSKHNIIRNNTFDNPWWTCFNLNASSDWTLIENNIFKNAGSDIGANVAPPPRTFNRRDYGAMQIEGASYNIIRNNIYYNSGSFNLNTDLPHYANDNKIYNNTGHNNSIGFYSNNIYDTKDNVLKNNIFSKSSEYSVKVAFSSEADKTFNWYANCFYNTENMSYLRKRGTLDKVKAAYPAHFLDNDNTPSDPSFTNPANQDFTLQPTSPAINAGTFLTTITSNTANSRTSLKVADAGYFYDGWGIPGEVGDIIKTQNGQTTTIQSINYDTNAIVVNPAINIIKNEGVALKYSGSAPDIGAFEFTGISIGR